MKNLNEEWMPVVGFEGLYEVSSHGNVRILYDRVKYKKGDLLKLYENGGYKRIWLFNGKIKKRFLVHRLVAFAFIEKVNGKDFINHINSNKSDNRVENLEWCTASENAKHGYWYGNIVINNPNKGKFGFDNHMSKAVYQYTLSYEFINKHGGVREAARNTGVGHRSIQYCCKGRYKKAGGYVWSYTEH